jgi:hypothetical protein
LSAPVVCAPVCGGVQRRGAPLFALYENELHQLRLKATSRQKDFLLTPSFFKGKSAQINF